MIVVTASAGRGSRRKARQLSDPEPCQGLAMAVADGQVLALGRLKSKLSLGLNSTASSIRACDCTAKFDTRRLAFDSSLIRTP